VDNRLKQRIIGAIVLIALAIIFLPAILKEKVDNGPFISKIPAKPIALSEYKIDTAKIDKVIDETNFESVSSALAQQSNEITTQVNSKSSSKKMPTVDSKKHKSIKLSVEKDKIKKAKKLEKPEKKTIDKSYRGAAWVIQVASFSKKSNAQKMIDKLKAKNFKAYRRKIISSNNQLYRVYVGPYIEKMTASKALPKINHVSKTQSMLKVFDPIEH